MGHRIYVPWRLQLKIIISGARKESTKLLILAFFDRKHAVEKDEATLDSHLIQTTTLDNTSSQDR